MERPYYVQWWIKPTKWTKAYIIERRAFTCHEDRMNYLCHERKKKWWESLPFVERIFFYD
jgi:hypothetical protein